jgi:predicted alpha/beta-fold hydrolase
MQSILLVTIVVISGSLDTTLQPQFEHSAHVWQPMIVKAMRDTLVHKFWGNAQKRLSPHELEAVLRAHTMVELDDAFFVKYHGFRDVHHYYEEMGAMGDGRTNQDSRISNVSVPLLMVHALDDPIAYWKCLGDPTNVVHSGKGNVVMLLTQKGGHVGWPIGWRPWKHQWEWINTAASSFLVATHEVSKPNRKNNS